MSQGQWVVIPDEDALGGRDPESRKCLPFQLLLDPGSRPASRNLAGMTKYDTVCQVGGKVRGWETEVFGKG